MREPEIIQWDDIDIPQQVPIDITTQAAPPQVVENRMWYDTANEGLVRQQQLQEERARQAVFIAAGHNLNGLYRNTIGNYTAFNTIPKRPKAKDKYTRPDINQWFIDENYPLSIGSLHVLNRNQLGIVSAEGHMEVFMNDELTLEDYFLMAHYKINDTTIELKNFINSELPDKFIIPYEGDKTELRIFLKNCVSVYRQNYGNAIANEFETQRWIVREDGTPTVHGVNMPMDTVEYLIKHSIAIFNDLNKQSNTIFNALVKAVKTKNIPLFVQNIKYISCNEIEKTDFKLFIEKLTNLLNGKIDQVLVSEANGLRNRIYKAFQNCYNVLNEAKPLKASKDIHYKMSSLRKPSSEDAVVKEYDNFYMYYNDNRDSFRNTIFIKLFKAPEVKQEQEIKIDLTLMYPKFISDINMMMVGYNNRWNKKDLDYSFDGVVNVWQSFSKIKNNLILLGYTEKESVDMILKEGFNSELNKREDKDTHVAVLCEITNQLIPECFIVPVTLLNGKTINMNIYYIWRANRVIPRYQLKNKKYTELKLPETYYYEQSKYEHTANVLEYLSPVKCTNENTKVFQEGKTYTPVPYMGVELEVERKDICKETITEDVLESLGRDFIILKHDGSLAGNKPFEIVSVPATLSAHKQKWHKFLADTALKTQLSSFTSGRCGMHIHISRDSFTGLHLAKFMRFINLESNAAFIGKIAQRGEVQYCKYTNYDTLSESQITYDQIKDKASLKSNPIKVAYKNIFKDKGRHTNHYDAVNTSNPHTIEVRIFRGNLARGHFFKNIEFVHALWLYTHDCSMQALDYKDFLFWLFKLNSKDYHNLMEWLVAAGFNVSNRNFTPNDKDKEAKKKEISKVKLIVNKKFNTKGVDTLRKSGKDTILTKSDLLANG